VHWSLKSKTRYSSPLSFLKIVIYIIVQTKETRWHSFTTEIKNEKKS
jgi:hypothetical protein